MVKPLQRIAVGGLLTAAAFFVSGFLELELMVKHGKTIGYEPLILMHSPLENVCQIASCGRGPPPLDEHR